MNETPKYATLLYDVLEVLDVSISEYFYLDMVHKLSYNRWCIKSIEHCASDMRISKRGLIKMRDRLTKRGLIKKNIKGHVKVTDDYIKIAVNKVPKSVNKVHSTGELSAHKNYNRITKNINGEQNSLNRYKTPQQMQMPDLS